MGKYSALFSLDLSINDLFFLRPLILQYNLNLCRRQAIHALIAIRKRPFYLVN